MSYSDRPWLKSYKLGPYKLEPTLEPYPVEPVYQALDKAAELYPGQTAIQFQSQSLKYRQLKSQVGQLAIGLAKLGLEPGDRICLFLANCIEFIIADWAALMCGAAVVPTSVLRSDEGLVHEVGSSGSKIIICSEEHLERVMGVRDQTDLEYILLVSREGYRQPLAAASLPKGVLHLDDLFLQEASQPHRVEIDPLHDLCELAFTGGATGVPKGVMITHANRSRCIRQGFPWLMKSMLRGLAGKASALVTVPLFHAYGHYVCQAAAFLGLRIILMPDSRDIKLMAELIREYRPFLITGVPTQFMRIAQEPLPRINSLLMSGSAPLPMEVAKSIQQSTGMPVSEGYGLTETSTLATMNVSAFSKITGFMPKQIYGIGIPIPDTECKLVDPENGLEVPLGKSGEIALRGPQVMKGYWPEVGSGLTKDGWLHTGDIATMDENGYLHLVDRVKDMVNVSGLKVYTTEVDEVLFAHPAVLMAAAFGVPDPEIPGSERVMAVIQLKKEYRGQISELEIAAYCREHLPPYAVPRRIELRSEELPLTVTDKVFKKVLRDEAVQKMEGRRS